MALLQLRGVDSVAVLEASLAPRRSCLKREHWVGRGDGGLVEMKWILALLAVQVLLTVPTHADRVYRTPEIGRIDKFDVPGALAWGMRGELGDTGYYVGLAILCKTDGASGVEVTASFSSFPGADHPVQLMIRTAGGKVERFGPVVAAGPESGFHSPQITDPGEAERFLRLALEPGSLVSNGYRSYWNRVSEARNQEVLEAFLTCVRGQGR